MQPKICYIHRKQNVRYFITLHCKFAGVKPLNALKVVLSPSKKNDSPSKIIKKAFYFILKAHFSFSRYLNFCLDFLVIQKTPLDQKDKINLEIRDVTAWLTKQLQYTHCPISPESKATRQFGQLIEYNKINILLQKSCRK